MSTPIGSASAQERAVALSRKGAEFHKDGQVDAARLHYLAAMSLDPQNVDNLQNLSGALYALEFFESASTVGRRGVALNPNQPYIRANLAISLIALGDCKEAEQHILKALQLKPDFGPFWHNYAQILYKQNSFNKALEAFDKSLELDPGKSDVENDRALCLLALGRYEDGLRAYEIRWKTLFLTPSWELGIPEWKGEDLAGKHLLIHHEQGFGDTIMLCRFIPELQARCAKLTVALPPELHRLVGQNFLGIDITNSMELEVEADFHAPFMSTLRWLKTRPVDISGAAYLRSTDPSPIALPTASRRIGICWASGDHGPRLRKRRRVIPLELFLPLNNVPGVQLISLQKGSGTERDILRLGAEGIVFDPMMRCVDFADTAAIISQLDLVISVDSSVAHVAAALGKPVIMLSPYTRCWRWLGVSHGWPWYNDLSILYQDADGTWNNAMQKVNSEVERVVLDLAA